MTRPDGPELVGTREQLVDDLVAKFLSNADRGDNSGNDVLVDEVLEVMRGRGRS